MKLSKNRLNKDNELKANIIHNSLFNLLYLTINKFGALIFAIILARMLLPEKYGIFSIVFSVSMIFLSFGDLGITYSFNKYLSRAVKYEKEKIKSYYRYLLHIKLISAVTAAIILLIAAYPISKYVFNNGSLLLPLVISAAYIFLVALDNFYIQVFYAIEKIEYLNYKELLFHILKIGLSILVLLSINSVYQVSGIFVVLAITTLIMILYSIYYTKRLLPEMYRPPSTQIDKKRILRFIGFIGIASLSTAFFSYIDSIMLGIYLPAEYVGYYKAAFSLVIGIIGLVSFPNIILLGTFSKISKKKTNLIFMKAISYASMMILPAIVGIIILSRYLVVLVYGNDYLLSSFPLMYLSFMIYPAVIIGIFLSIFSAENRPEIFAKITLTTTILNIILNYIFINLFIQISFTAATAGVGIATTISWLFYLCAAFYFVRKRFKFKALLRSALKPLIASLLMGASLIVVLNIIKNIEFTSGILIVLLGIFIYFIILFLTGGIQKREVISIINYFLSHKKLSTSLG